VAHPLPSLLVALVVAVVAVAAGAGPTRVALLALAMLALQLSIGATNDWADAARDAVNQPAKPIPSGAVGRDDARLIAILAALLGLSLAALAGPLPAILAAAGLCVGLAYDLRLKGSRWSWLPYAIGIPLLPVFAWAGATGGLPVAFLLIAPLAVLAGTSLAVANALGDVDEDRLAGVVTVATALGPRRAHRLVAGLVVVVVVGAFVTAAALGATPGWLVVQVLASGVAVAGAAGGALGPGMVGRHAWEVQAIGLAIVAAAWFGSAAAAGAMTG
jgi:4-hydroxybenzoate polyprenyltransferase